MSAMVPVVPYLRLRDVVTDTIVAHTTNIHTFLVETVLDGPGTLAYSVPAGDAVYNALVACAGGVGRTLPTKVYQSELSLDNGVSFDARAQVKSIQLGIMASVSGPCLWDGYVETLVDRVTFAGVKLADAINGGAGTVQAIPQSGGASPVKLPYQKGVLQTIPGDANWTGHTRLQMFPKFDAKIATLIVDGDQNVNFLDRAAAEFLDTASGVQIPGDTLPIGSRAHFVADTSDASLNITGAERGIAFGKIGTAPFVTYTTDAVPTNSNQAQILEDQGELVTDTQLGDIVAKLRGTGGYTNHGLPDGFRITCLCYINTNHGSDSIYWYESLLIFGAVDSSGFGGLYYWPGDGIAYRIGQGIEGVSGVAWDGPSNTLYCCGKGGAFSRTASVLTRANWVRLGSLNAPCDGLQWDTGVLVVQVSGSGSVDTLYRYPAFGGGVGSDTLGYKGWTNLHASGDLLGWRYIQATDTLVFADRNSPTTVWVQASASDSTGPDAKPLLTPEQTAGDADSRHHVTALSPLDGATAILTATGALGMFRLANGTTSLLDMNPDQSMLDPTGNPPIVNAVIAGPVNLVIGFAALPASLMALTDNGIFYSGSATGGGWVSRGTQSGISDQNITLLAFGSPHTLAGDRTTTDLAAWSGRALWLSPSAGIWWDADSEDKVSIGKLITDLCRKYGGGQFLNRDVTGIGTGVLAANTGTSGTILSIPPGAVDALPDGVCWLTPYDERNKRVYRLVDTRSLSPSGKIVPADFPNITTDAATGAATASGRLGAAMLRVFGERRVVQNAYTVRSVLAFANSKLRAVRPTYMVAVNYDTTPVYGTKFVNARVYVLRHRMSKAQADAEIRTETDVATTLRTAFLTENQITEGLAYTQSRITTYAKSR